MLKPIFVVIAAVQLTGAQDFVKPLVSRDFELLPRNRVCAMPLKELRVGTPRTPSRLTRKAFETMLGSDRIDKGIEHPVPMPACSDLVSPLVLVNPVR